MKKFLLIALMAIAGVAYAAAQPRAIGANLGSGIGFSYQHNLGEKNMLDVAANVPLFELGKKVLGVGGHVTYDWIDPFGTSVPWNEKGEWHWYMGVGGAAGAYFGLTEAKGAWWHAGVAGHVGIEYDFWFPMQLSVDWRPEIGVSNYGNEGKVGFGYGGLYGISLGVRYLF